MTNEAAPESPVGEGTTPDPPEQEESFSAFYQREHAGQVRRATLLTGSPETAHDVVHDAFVQVYRRWDSLTAAGPYLARAVLNGCRDVGRRRATAAAKLPLLVERPEPPDEVLWDALMALPFNHRAAVVCRYYLQLPERETADLLGCRPGSVGPWTQRGLAALRKALA